MNKKAAAEVDEEVLARFRREQVNLQESLQNHYRPGTMVRSEV